MCVFWWQGRWVKSRKQLNFFISSSLSSSSSVFVFVFLLYRDLRILPFCVASFSLLFSAFASRLISSSRFVVTIEAQVGGVKKGNNEKSGGRFTIPQLFSMNSSMNTTIRRTKFAFDLEPPYHCLSKSNNCSVFPIFLNRSMTSVSLTSIDSQHRSEAASIDAW